MSSETIPLVQSERDVEGVELSVMLRETLSVKAFETVLHEK